MIRFGLSQLSSRQYFLKEKEPGHKKENVGSEVSARVLRFTAPPRLLYLGAVAGQVDGQRGA